MSGFAHELERRDVTKTEIPVFHVGDTLDVHVRIKEGDKERVQIFAGVCIARKGGGLRETFTVRRIVEGEGVERIFPLHSPNVAKIEVKRAGKVRRAKLYYLRDRVGKATRIIEKLNAGHLGKMDETRTADEKPAAKVEEKPAETEEKPADAEQDSGQPAEASAKDGAQATGKDAEQAEEKTEAKAES